MLNQFKPINKPQKVNVLPIENYLNEQNKILDEVNKVLQLEFVCIRDRKLEKLEAIAEKKSSLVLKLQQNDQLLKLHPNSAELKTKFLSIVKGLKDKLVKCQRTNEINGKLINACIASSRRLSAVLMGARDRSTKNMTYTDKGNTVARGPERLNIEA